MGREHTPLRRFCAAVLFFLGLPSQAADLADPNLIPQLTQAGRDDYQQNFLHAGTHRAFVIAPGGAWAWSSGQASGDEAVATALKSCRGFTDQQCVPYAVDQAVVFDAGSWAGLWRLEYAGPVQSLPVGVRRGQRFPDVVFTGRDGKPRKLSDLQGRIVMLHFWGSWCPPCMRELPSLDILHRILKDRLPGQVELVLLQVREPIGDARTFLELQGWDQLPLYDSGARDSAHDYLDLAGGGRVADRELARVFPSTYVIDGNGVVLFSHVGPVDDWSQYLPLFEAAARTTGASGQ